MHKFRVLLITLMTLCCMSAHAKRFRNAYVSFELPPNWNCKLEGSEWVCENDFSGKTKEAIIILTAKEVGPTDTLAAYLAHLQTPRMIAGAKGQLIKSQVIHVKERMIANQMWVDGMHLGSEVGPYFTRYLATIKERIAILVTFSAHKEHFTKYSGDFIRAVESLRVVATRDSLGDRGGGGVGGGSSETIGAPIGQGVSQIPTDGLPTEGSGRGKKLSLINLLLLAVILGAIGFYIYWKSKNKPRRPNASSGDRTNGSKPSSKSSSKSQRPKS
jgi:hypothetical protein